MYWLVWYLSDCFLVCIDSDFDELDSPVIAKAMFMTKIEVYEMQDKDNQWQPVDQYH